MENKLYDKMQEAWESMKTLLSKQNEYMEARGRESAELKERIEKVNNRIDELETKIARPNTEVTGVEESTAKKEFRDYILKGIEPSSLKAALITGNQGAAGYLAPPEFVAEVNKFITPLSPIRTVARVIPSNAYKIQVPVRTGAPSATLVTDGTDVSEDSSIAYGLVNIQAYDIRVWRGVSNLLLTSAGVDLESELAADFAEAIAYKEGYYFVSGDGSDEPEGIMQNTSIPSVVTGNASALTADGIINAFYTLPEQFARNATWALKRQTLGTIRTFKDGSGNYLWQPALGELSPATILGRPYIECPDMPAVGASAYPVIIGDFRAGYTILDHQDIQIIRDPYTLASYGVIRFVANKAVGGAVVNANAFVKVKVAAS